MHHFPIFAIVLRTTTILLLFLCGLGLNGPYAQSSNDPETLKAALENTNDRKERYSLLYRLTEVLTKSDAEEAIRYGDKAVNEAEAIGDKQLIADASYLLALAYEQDRNLGKTEAWLKVTTRHAMDVKDANLILKAVDKRTRMATRDRNYRRATEINREALDFFTRDGNDIASLRAAAEGERSRLEKMANDLAARRQLLEDELEILQEEQEILEEENDQLLTANERRKKQLEAKQRELSKVEEEKVEVEDRMVASQAQVANLSRQALEKQAAVDRVQRELAEQQLAASQAELRARDAEVAQNESESLRNYAVGMGAFLLLLSALLYSRFISKRRDAKALATSNAELAVATQRSDELLLNILPAGIAEELKEKGEATARKFDDTTILFSDFVNFTRISEQLGPVQLVKELDICFRAFDKIIGQYPDVEKIKTIGDAYMIAHGLDERKSIPVNLIEAARQMQQFLNDRATERKRLGLPFFAARIGLHTGPVVAGVVGVTKFGYDVWGDTVNTAARVESQCEPGRINVSETTYRLIKYQFECEYRGKVMAKNKGYIDMYYVK
jgi:class 3 adenylate cyclase